LKNIQKNKKDPFDGIFGKGKFSVKNDAFDRKDFEDIKKRSKKLMELNEALSKDYEPFEELQQDMYSSLYKYVPELEDEFKLKKEFLLNQAIMKELMETQRYKELRIMTKLDKIHSTIGAEALSEEATEILKQLKEQQQAFQEMLDAAAGVEQAVGDKNAGDKELENAKNGGTGEAKEKLTVEEAKKKLEEAKKNFKESMAKQEVKKTMEKAVGRVKDTVQETSEFIENWGLEGSPDFMRKPYHEKMELINKLRNNEKFKRIAMLAGKYKRMMLQRQYEKVKKGADEIHTIVQGSDLSRLLPSELMKLLDPITENQFIRDFYEGKLLQYDLTGKDKKCKGAIVICIDDSGSMNGTPEINLTFI
jgi:uncharacterized protein with von Willebrand factor type A (vWA) domain